MVLHGSKVSLNKEEPQDIYTGRSSSPSNEASDSELSDTPLVMASTPSYHVPSPPKSMYGRKTPGSPTLNLNLGASLSSGTPQRTGTPSWTPASVENWMKFPLTFWYVITLPSDESPQIICLLNLWKDSFTYFGDRLVLENLEWPGQKGVLLLTLKIHCQNSGTDTVVRNTLSSMNLGELSTSPMYFDGSIVTQSLWRSKALPSPW